MISHSLAARAGDPQDEPMRLIQCIRDMAAAVANAMRMDREVQTPSRSMAAALPKNPHPDGCWTPLPRLTTPGPDCAGDGHYACRACARHDAALGWWEDEIT